MRIVRVMLLVLAGLWMAGVQANDETESTSFQDKWAEDPTAALKEQAEIVNEEMSATFETEQMGEDESTIRDALLREQENQEPGASAVGKIEIEIEAAPLALPPLNSE